MALNHTGTVELETNRLKLRRFVPEDAEMMFANWAGDPVVTEYLSWDPHASSDATRSLLDIWCAQYEDLDHYNWAIEYEGEIVGNISVVRVRERNERATIGYCLAHHHWGKGIMPEAFSAVIDYRRIPRDRSRARRAQPKERARHGKVRHDAGRRPPRGVAPP